MTEPAGSARARGRRGDGGGRRPGRPAGDTGTKEAIGEAARAQFADFGYHGATIRGIAAAAGVDPALVHHYFGSKEALFAAAMRLPVLPSEVMTAALSGPGPAAGPAASSGAGAHLVRTALGLWESEGLRETFLGLLKSAVTSEQAAVMLREFLADSILDTMTRVTGLAERVGPAEAQYRASMVATQMLGLAMTRLVLRLPSVTGVSIDELAATVGPSVERYLAGDIDLPAAVRRANWRRT